jgi:hypothetical protein
MAYPTLIPLQGDPTTWTPPAAGYINVGVNLSGQIVTQQPNGVLATSYPSSGMVVVTAGSYSVLATDRDLLLNFAGTATLTLGTPTNGRELWLRTIQADAVVSATANVIPLAGGAAGTAILAATAGKWCRLVGDGSNWQITAAN